MLLFIRVSSLRQCQKGLFQYISCYCLSIKQTALNTWENHFNTSHVTVYRQTKGSYKYMVEFQYISCYCLSKYKNGPRLPLFNFNTSHVTVYLSSLPCRKLLLQISIHLMLLFIFYYITDTDANHRFQYISCYCLSHKAYPVIRSD